MKKIMFNDKHGLTKAVLNGTKTMTRRIVKDINLLQFLKELEEDGSIKRIKGTIIAESNAPYKIGDIVAVAQSYKELYPDADFKMVDNSTFMTESEGWNNKLFVRAGLMPRHIRITDIKVERLHDISDEDCLKEGLDWIIETPGILKKWTFFGTKKTWNTRREAFAALIDRISGKGTWDSNPWVFAYSFELID